MIKMVLCVWGRTPIHLPTAMREGRIDTKEGGLKTLFFV
jgi:hypothetical protein